MSLTLVAFSGSLRRGSYNRLLVEQAARGAENAGATVRRITLGDFKLPLYDADAEGELGMPEGARALRELCSDSAGYLIAAPEYNGSLSAALKNALDWLSRPLPNSNETALSLTAFRNKVAGILSASPGNWGGVRGLAHVRQILSGMGVLVTAEQLAVPRANEAFDDVGRLVNPANQTLAESIGARTVMLARALQSREQ
ncbi:MAG: NADPH-dependent FMN reductase [Rhizomicrobium sp.]